MLGLNIKRFHFTCGADILVCGFWRLSSRQFILENTGKFRESRRGGPRGDSKAALHSKRKRFKWRKRILLDREFLNHFTRGISLYRPL